MKSKLFRLAVPVIALGFLGGLSLPLSNLVIGLPTSNSLVTAKADDPNTAKAMAIMGQKCANCHTQEYVLPFYAKFPPAKQLVELDIRLGIEAIDMKEAFADAPQPSEVALAKNEYVLQQGSMPPVHYLAVHWNGILGAEEKEALMTWIRESRQKHYATPGAPAELAGAVLQPIPSTHNEDPAKVALGDRLFHDKRLSKDNTIACASCHGLDKGGTDQKQFSEGVGAQFGDINAPTVYNSGFQFIQFWDGRAADLQEQADGPVNNPIEMASNWAEAIPKLQQDAELTAAFNAVYPQGYSKETITEAIATFERTLITPNSKFDKFLMGDQAAMSEEQKRGHELFVQNACATCHAGKAMGGQSFEKLGRKSDYFKIRGTEASKPDFGRFNVTQKAQDKYKLKTPTLRNIALTHPYMHDGTVKTLPDAVDIMGRTMVGKKLTAADSTAIAAFLEALTGEYNGKALQ